MLIISQSVEYSRRSLAVSAFVSDLVLDLVNG